MPEWVELRRNIGQRGLLITSYKGLKKDSDRTIINVVEAVCVSAHLVPPGSLQPKQLGHLHIQLSLGQSCHRQKVLCLYTATLWSCPTLCDPVDCGLPGFSVRGVLQARILECIGQYWSIGPKSQQYFYRYNQAYSKNCMKRQRNQNG